MTEAKHFRIGEKVLVEELGTFTKVSSNIWSNTDGDTILLEMNKQDSQEGVKLWSPELLTSEEELVIFIGVNVKAERGTK